MDYKKELLTYLEQYPEDMVFIDDIESEVAELALKQEDADADFIHSDAFFRQLSFDAKDLISSGDIMVSKKGKIGMPEAFGLMRGTMLVNEKGYGFFRPSGEDRGADIFVRKDKMLGAMNGDIVLVRKWHTNRGVEAEVKHIAKRSSEMFIGILKGNEVVPKDAKIYRKLILAENAISAKEGDVLMVEPISWTNDKRPIRCRAVEVLGQQGDKGIDILEVAMRFGLYKEFDRAVLDEANALSEEITTEGRLDLRELETVTIDGADAKDIDDAISIMDLSTGAGDVADRTSESTDGKQAAYRLYVHIADVSHYVTKDSVLDEEAVKRGTSAYLLDRVVPMLPERLSNNLCSLNEEVERYAITCSMDYSADGELLAHEISKSVIKVDHHLTYLEVTEYLVNAGVLSEESFDKSNYRPINEDTLQKCVKCGKALQDMYRLSRILRELRMKRGAIDFSFPEPSVVLNEEGLAVDVVTRARTSASEIIEDFMLAANETVAEHFYWLEKPFVYRVHESPNKDKVEHLRKYLTFFGFKLKGKDDNVGIANLIKEIKNTKYESAISMATLRSLMQAKYCEENLGHFGLKAKFYCHFTAPIRRYPDLVVHRIISNYLAESGDFVKDTSKGLDIDYCREVAQNSSQREQNAEQAERTVTAMKMAEFMQAHIGETFDGTISSVTNYGFFVTLDNLVDGLVHVTRLPKDSYEFNEERLSLVGSRTGVVYTIGDRVEVTVSAASSESGRVDLSMIPDFVLEKNRKARRVATRGSHTRSYSHRGSSRGKDRRGGKGRYQARGFTSLDSIGKAESSERYGGKKAYGKKKKKYGKKKHGGKSFNNRHGKW